MKGALKGIGIAIIMILISCGTAFAGAVHPFLPLVICCVLVIVLFGYMFYDGEHK